ncbi:IS30 family transposase [Candidatus Giovannonibacteria bacterium]|nr:IS30 family transposase [Candidatus Giovannonibacteria bacterium]
MYTHLKRDQRIALAALLRSGYSRRQAAKEIGVDHTTVGREVTRNPITLGRYHAGHADVLARMRRKRSRMAYRTIENNPELVLRIEKRLHPLVSPEVIAHDESISHVTVYAWIYRSRPDLLLRLPQRGKKRRRYGSKRAGKQGWTTKVRPIDARPAIIDQRLRVGDFEGDTVRGKNGSLLTLTDRKSRFEVVVKMPGDYCDLVHAAIVKIQRKVFAKSYTFDRGSCFSLWPMIERDAGVRVYFAHPRSPWDLSWHGRNNYYAPDSGSSTTTFSEILKSYAYEGSGKNYTFLTITRELKPEEAQK